MIANSTLVELQRKGNPDRSVASRQLPALKNLNFIAMIIAIDSNMVIIMRTIQMTLDDDLVHELDTIVKESNTNRSAFARDALRKAITYYHQLRLAEKHRKGYQKHPVQDDEFSDWEGEQAWGDE